MSEQLLMQRRRGGCYFSRGGKIQRISLVGDNCTVESRYHGRLKSSLLFRYIEISGIKTIYHCSMKYVGMI